MSDELNAPYFRRFLGKVKGEPRNALLFLVALYDQKLQDFLLNESNKNPDDIINHCREQIKNVQTTIEAESLPDDWHRFEWLVSAAERKIGGKAFREACFYFYWLGQKAEFLTHWRCNEELIRDLDFKVSKSKSERPFADKAKKQNQQKLLCQDLAKLFWQYDRDKKSRTGEVSKRVWKALEKRKNHDDFDKFYGSIAEERTVRLWVSKVAPAYAKIGGRPKKSK